MFCVKCGAKLADDAKFCHSCGTKTEAVETREISLFENKETPKNDSNEAIKKLIGSNYEYYLEQFAKIYRGEKPKFNWAAFLFGFYHAVYRNMWRETFKVYLGPILLEILGVIMFLLFADTFNFNFVFIGSGMRLLGAVWMLIVHIWYGKNFNKLYEEHVNKVLWNVRDSSYLQAETSMGRVFALIAITIICGVAMQSYVTSKMLDTNYSEVPNMGAYESAPLPEEDNYDVQNEVFLYEEHLPTYENSDPSETLDKLENNSEEAKIFDELFKTFAIPIETELIDQYQFIDENHDWYKAVNKWTDFSATIDMLGNLKEPIYDAILMNLHKIYAINSHLLRIEGIVTYCQHENLNYNDYTLLELTEKNHEDYVWRLYIRGYFEAQNGDTVVAAGSIFNGEYIGNDAVPSLAVCYAENVPVYNN